MDWFFVETSSDCPSSAGVNVAHKGRGVEGTVDRFVVEVKFLRNVSRLDAVALTDEGADGLLGVFHERVPERFLR